MTRPGAALLPLGAWLALASAAAAQVVRHPDQRLEYVYPAGARAGQSVTVELGGVEGLTGATGLVVDGPPGVVVKGFKAVSAALAQATLEIAADAEPGRRLLRVAGGSGGLTNFRPFFVGRLPEVAEKE